VRRHIVDSYQALAILSKADEIEAMVDPSQDPIVLRSPGGSHDSVGELVGSVLQPRRLDLGEKPAELADNVCALKIGRKPLEMTTTITLRTYCSTTDSILSALT
jgi:hypothetical protein